MTTFSLSTIARAHILGSVTSRFSTMRPLPTNIGQYSLVSPVKKNSTFQEFLVGLYSNGAKFAIGKTWSGSHPFFYHSLKNEANLYKLLCKKAQELAFRTPRALKHIHIPQILGYQETSKSLSLLIEHISGKRLYEYSTDVQKEEYLKAVYYLRYLGENMSSYEKTKIGKRTGLSEAISYPVFFVIAIIQNFRQSLIILKSSVTFISTVRELISQKRFVLTHRDLHFNNILVCKNAQYIIDLEFAVYALPEHELVTTLISQWKNKTIRKFLIIELSKYNPVVVKALLIKTSTHYLISSKLTSDSKKRYFEILQKVSNGTVFKGV